jgi:hypothetical protein
MWKGWSFSRLLKERVGYRLWEKKVFGLAVRRGVGSGGLNHERTEKEGIWKSDETWSRP